MTRILVIEAFDFASDETMPLADFVKMVTEAYEAIPAEFRDTAVFRYESCWSDYGSSTCKAEYTRPETDKEAARRKAEEAAYEADRLARERAQYERLKAKYDAA